MPGHSKLINYLEIIGFLDEHNISFDEINSPVKAEYERIETDSRLVTKNSVFVCISGFENDGHDFASKAITNGASLLIVQKKIDPDIPQIKVRNSRKVAAILAKLFFNDPTSKMKLIGITGTNGKTTVASLISKLLLSKNKKTGLIGTFGYEINGKKYRSERTTPDIIDLNKIFLKMLKAEVEFVVMEVSSHALALDRVFGLHYNAGVFTNLTHEHLDFHKNMEKYAQTKFQLFENITDNNGIAIINIDDKYGKELYRKINCLKKDISFKEGDISIRDINYSL
ncbi:MAG TPA: UDP-N-acetylmuramoyl-L-alanyl-D-glutamate--2,6-diaminopimelate ligase, partial [Candidatus Cloacimonetes bacterium]|nr:UDP-N-acetylmuramoyl-L-alanyl-D-glutamate--2,6-diaminopimelate ligase [Candidatus Cloacimonadota bacterium]